MLGLTDGAEPSGHARGREGGGQTIGGDDDAPEVGTVVAVAVGRIPGSESEAVHV